MSEWVVKKLDEVVEYFIDYRGKTPDKKDSGIPLITAKIVKDGRLNTATEFISVEDYPLWMSRGYPEVNDVVLTTEAPLGEVALIKNKNVALAQRIITLRGYKNILDNKFLKYWLQSEQGQYELESRASGTTVFGIKSSVLKKIPISLPPYNQQVAISSVLYSIDEKIDLLHRQNKTLESMAETLFRQWFIEDAQEGWSETTIGEIFTLNGGSTPSTKNDDFWDGDISWTSPRDLSGSESIFLMSTERKITSLGLKRISSGLLPVRTLLMSSRAPIGYLSITDIPVAINQGYIAIHENPDYHSEYMYLWCKLNMETIKNSGNGSVFQEISKSSFRNLTFIEPPKEKVESFNELTRDLFEKNRLNIKQIRRLEKLRDTLLPKLMSGEVQVKYAEEAIASVA